ncbi:MAG: hypothetical protein COB46_10795 [Rhodospirillaceae bacterium]|nr:MAG: hypothetical protein COB46_10795 [Rhodospirillaceae bacterium]
MRSILKKEPLMILAGIGVLGLLGFISMKFFLKPEFDRVSPLISDEITRYFAMDFVPKYLVNDCVVKFEVSVKNGQIGYKEETNVSFWRYISRNEPKIGVMNYQNYIPNENYVYFADQCDRRDEIFEGMIGEVNKFFADKINIKRLPIEVAVTGFDRLWLDSPGSVPEYWPIYHEAIRGNGKAFLDLLQFEKKDDFDRLYLFSALAEYYLPDGPLKNEARLAKAAALKNIHPERHNIQLKMVDHWVQFIEKYKPRCQKTC